MSLKYQCFRERNYRLIYTRHGRKHKIGRPAVIYDNSGVYWYVYGIFGNDKI